jgi:hypothetical protein
VSDLTENTAAARAAVDTLRANGGSPVAVASALLGLSQALDLEERGEEAGVAVREGIETLTASFLADPPPLTASMRALLAQYLSIAGRGGCDLDPFLILPVAAELGPVRADPVADKSVALPADHGGRKASADTDEI